MRIAEQVLQQIDRHGMISAGMHVGVAVSGGADSTCLLHLLHELGPRWNLHLHVIHIDHGLRGESSRTDSEFVRHAAGQFALPFHLREAHLSLAGENLEQAARRARHDFYRELLTGGVLDRIATGHTRSDQAETVLYRFLRGSGNTGLCGILPVTREGLVRPLLSVTREEILAWLESRALEWREDETNQSRRFVRNRLRLDVLPMLRQQFNPQIDAALAHLSVLAQDEEDYWARLVGEEPIEGTAVHFEIAQLAGVHPALARRRIRRAIEQVKGNLRQIDFTHIEGILEMARSEQGSGRVQLPGLEVFRSFGGMRIAPAGFDPVRDQGYLFSVSVPGSITLPGNGGVIRFELSGPEEVPRSRANITDELDWQRLTSFTQPDAAGAVGAKSGRLELRNWRPGDQYRRTGEQQPQKIKFLFQDARVPIWERRHWPVLIWDDRILWSRRFGPAAEFAAGTEARWILRVRDERSLEPISPVRASNQCTPL